MPKEEQLSSEQKEEKAIQRAWFAALVCGGATLTFALFALGGRQLVPGLNAYAIIDAATLFGLGFGVYKRSRICAVLLLAYTAGSEIWIISSGAAVKPSPLRLIFIYFYLRGMLAIFAHHRRIQPAAIPMMPAKTEKPPAKAPFATRYLVKEKEKIGWFGLLNSAARQMRGSLFAVSRTRLIWSALIVIMIISVYAVLQWFSGREFRQGRSLNVPELAAAARPAIVLLSVYDSSGKLLKTGTGFFVSSDGKLITNWHVVKGGASAEAKLEDGAIYKIKGILESSEERDLAVLKADAKHVPFLKLEQRREAIVGTRVAVIGSPLGLEGTVSEGIISAVRSMDSEEPLIQITAPVSPGSSGSPVINSEGIVIGIATFILKDSQSLNFARPAREAAELLNNSTAAVIKSNAADARPLSAMSKADVSKDPEYLAARRALENNDGVGALKLLTKLDQKFPNNPTILRQMAEAYLDLGWFKDAIASCDRAFKLDPSDVRTWVLLALAQADSGDYYSATAAAEQAIKIQPDSQKAWGLLGHIHLANRQTDEAINALKQSVKIDADFAPAWEDLASAYQDSGDLPRAIEARLRLRALSTQTGASSGALIDPNEIRATQAFATRFVRALESNDVFTLCNSYANIVDWHDKGMVDNDFIRNTYPPRSHDSVGVRYYHTYTLVGDAQVSSGDSSNWRKVIVEYLFNDLPVLMPGSIPFPREIGSATLEWQVSCSGDNCKIYKERLTIEKHSLPP
jgi:S1-C subfamily serine protease/Tfp pilus assembly protein PilF